MAKRITELSTKAGDLSSSDVFLTDDGNVTSKIDYTALADSVVKTHEVSSLYGQTRTVKAAIDTIGAKVDELDTKTSDYGAPFIAATVADMTDQARIYVYVGSETGYTAGNWYYYNGTAWVSGGVYNSTALQTDKTLSMADMAADAKKTGDGIKTINNRLVTELENYAAQVTVNKGYYAQNTGSYVSNSSYRSFKVACSGAMPLYFGTTITPSRIIFMLNGSFSAQYTPDTLPADLPDFDEVRINFKNATFETGDITVYAFGTAKNMLQYPKRVNAALIAEMGWRNLHDLPVNCMYQMGNDIPTSFAIKAEGVNSTLIVLKATARGTKDWNNIYINSFSGNIYVRNGGAAWHRITMETEVNGLLSEVSSLRTDVDDILEAADLNGINVLCVGNSYTQDEISYVPALIKERFPNLKCVFGILFQGGETLEGHYTRMANDTAYAYYHEYDWDNDRWVNTADVKLSTVLAMHNWDIIATQQSSDLSVDYTTYQPFLNDWIDGVCNRITKNVKFAFIMNHVWGANDPRLEAADMTSDEMFESRAFCVQKVYDETAISEIIPTGTAVQNARTTSLDSLGTEGHMCEDTSSHLQNGMPCLPPAYVMFAKVCEWLGKPYTGIMGSQILPTQAWTDAQNIPGKDGTAQGATAANRLIAAKCAIMALKKPFEITDCADLAGE
jgi:hypothetical protein